MGTTTGQKRLCQSLSFKHDIFHLDDLDHMTEKGFELVKNTELFRCRFTPLWNEFLKQSGAIVIESPHFESGMSGLLMKIACDLNGNLYNNLIITSEEPFINIKSNNSDLSGDANLIIDSFKKVSTFAKGNMKTIEEMEASYLKFIRDIGYLQKDHEKYFSSRGVPPGNIIENSKKLKKYLKTFKTGYDICLQMKNYINEVNICLGEYADYSKNEEIMLKYERIGRDANRKNIIKAPKIMFKFSPEKKIINYEDYYDRVTDFGKIERNCNQTLAFYSLGLSEEMNKKTKTEKTNSSVNKENMSKEGSKNNNDGDQCMMCKGDEKCMMCKSKMNKDMNDGNQCKMCKGDEKCDMCKANMESMNKKMNDSYQCKMCKSDDKCDMCKANMNNKDNDNDNDIKISKAAKDSKGKNTDIKLEDSDIINNVDSDESEDSQEDIKKITKEINSHEGDNDNIENIPKINLTSSHIPFKSINKIHLENTIRIYPQDTAYPTAFAFIKDRDMLVTGLSNGALIFTNLSTVTEEKVILCHCKKVTSILYMNDGKTIITGSKDGKIYKHDLDDYESTIIGTEDSIDAMTDLMNNFSILVATNKEVIAFDYVKGKKLYSFTAHDDKIKDMIYNQSKDMLITCSRDKKIKLWNASTKECIGILKGITNTVNSLCFANDKNNNLIIVSASKDGFITFWNLSDKNLTKSLKMKTTVIKVIYLENEKNVIGINSNGTFSLYDLDTNDTKDYNSNDNNSNSDTNIKYSTGLYFNDGSTIVLGTRNTLVQLWNC